VGGSGERSSFLKSFPSTTRGHYYASNYRAVYSEGSSAKAPATLKVKDVICLDHRYIVCLNENKTQKGAEDHQGYDWHPGRKTEK